MIFHSDPEHYTRYDIEPATFIMRNGLDFWRGAIIKYVMRAGYKDVVGLTKAQAEIADLQKATRFAQMRINQLNGETEL